MFRSLLAVLALAAAFAVRADDPIPVRVFADWPDFEDVKISPDGAYLAASMESETQSAIGIIRLSDGKLLKNIGLPNKATGIGDFWWVGPQRVVIALTARFGSLELPALTGELLGLDIDGGNATYLFGERGGGTSRQAGLSRGWATMIDPRPEDGHHAIIAAHEWDSDGGGVDKGLITVYQVDVDGGQLAPKTVSPITGNAEFVTDAQGVVRYAVGEDHFYHEDTFYKPDAAAEWKHLNTGSLAHAAVIPLRFSADGSKVYLESNEDSDRSCLIEHDLANDTRRHLSCDEVSDAGHVLFSPTRVPLGVIYPADRPRIQWLPSDDPLLPALQQLQKAFPGQIVVPVSRTLDGSTMVVLAYSDRNPGAYYLFDPKSLKAEALMVEREGIKPEQMGERRPVQFKSRDGTLIHGYLTLPPGKPAHGLPLVVNPHGGPFGIRDGWRWEPEPQLLASRGYAVLQVNFRGSGGYGRKYFDEGKQRWDSVMIDDITDGARWTIGQGIADAQRLCIYGGSYGGYAALMSALREPDLYRCVIDYAGVYDLNLQRTESDTSRSSKGRYYLQEFVGSSPEKLTAASPAGNIDKLKAAIMIAHGEDDERVPFSNAKALRKALDKMHHPYEWMAKEGEGHGFRKMDNRVEFYTKLLEFLDRNIGAGFTPTASAEPATPAADAAPAPSH
mgnify:CR=1 FL=1